MRGLYARTHGDANSSYDRNLQLNFMEWFPHTMHAPWEADKRRLTSFLSRFHHLTDVSVVMFGRNSVKMVHLPHYDDNKVLLPHVTRLETCKYAIGLIQQCPQLQSYSFFGRREANKKVVRRCFMTIAQGQSIQALALYGVDLRKHKFLVRCKHTLYHNHHPY